MRQTRILNFWKKKLAIQSLFSHKNNGLPQAKTFSSVSASVAILGWLQPSNALHICTVNISTLNNNEIGRNSENWRYLYCSKVTFQGGTKTDNFECNDISLKKKLFQKGGKGLLPPSGGKYSDRFRTEMLCPRSRPLTLSHTKFWKIWTISHTKFWKSAPLSHTFPWKVIPFPYL